MSSDANDYTRFDGIEDSDDEGKATPTTSNLQESLVEASICKDKGNALFNEGDFEGSKVNYEDGLKKLKEFLPKDGNGDIASDLKALLVGLYGNCAMVALKLNNYRDAMQSSSLVLKYDSGNVKSLYRRAVAYNNLGYYDDAKEDLNKILAKDPTNASAKKELIDVQRNLKEKKQNEKKNYANLFNGTSSIYEDREKERLKKLRREEEEKAKLEDDWTKSKLSRRAQGLSEQTFEEYKKEIEKNKEEEQQAAAKKVDTPPVVPKKAVSKKVEDEEQYDDEEAKIIEETKKKGYCYFKKEQSSEVKELIGDITPKAIGSADAPVMEVVSTTPVAVDPNTAAVPTPVNNSKASSWNFAGTFEAREMTSVAVDKFKSKLETISVTADNGCNGNITSAKVEGEAQIVHTRGKTKYIYDFNAILDFEITVDAASESSKKYKGVIKFPDISADFNQENSISYKKTVPSDHQARVKAVTDTLVRQAIENWRNFDVEYKSM